MEDSISVKKIKSGWSVGSQKKTNVITLQAVELP